MPTKGGTFSREPSFPPPKVEHAGDVPLNPDQLCGYPCSRFRNAMLGKSIDLRSTEFTAPYAHGSGQRFTDSMPSLKKNFIPTFVGMTIKIRENDTKKAGLFQNPPTGIRISTLALHKFHEFFFGFVHKFGRNGRSATFFR